MGYRLISPATRALILPSVEVTGVSELTAEASGQGKLQARSEQHCPLWSLFSPEQVGWEGKHYALQGSGEKLPRSAPSTVFSL